MWEGGISNAVGVMETLLIIDAANISVYARKESKYYRDLLV